MSQSETRLNAIFNDVMATDGYGRVLGVLTKVLVTMQKSMGEGMERYFTALSLPTRSDVVEFGERLSRIESRLHSIEDDLAKMAGGEPDAMPCSSAATSPPRTRKPASAKGGGIMSAAPERHRGGETSIADGSAPKFSGPFSAASRGSTTFSRATRPSD